MPHWRACRSLPEVEGLAAFLRERAVGRVVARVDVASINVLKTFDPPPTSLAGLEVTGADRHGKWLDLDVSGLHLVFHLSKAGWLRWSDEPARDAAEAGQGADRAAGRPRRRLGVRPHRGRHEEAARRPRRARRDPGAADRLARPRPARPVVRPRRVRGAAGRSADAGQGAAARPVGAVGRRQRLLRRGAARGEDVAVRHRRLARRGAGRRACTPPCSRCCATPSPAPPASRRSSLKDAKRSGMRVHGRTGQACPVCGDVVREVSLRRLRAAVLRHLPDRRQAAGRPPHVAAAQVGSAHERRARDLGRRPARRRRAARRARGRRVGGRPRRGRHARAARRGARPAGRACPRATRSTWSAALATARAGPWRG
nr:DNA-formamidopyrimidine glycosylase family protein [Angustibacter aerolatus]